jgi:alcohol dehydrogenase class IV
MNILRGNWNYPTSIRFGAGRIAELPEACKTLRIARPLLVTDPGLAALPMISRAVEACRKGGLACSVFSEVQANPVEANVNQGVTVYRSGGHDGVIAFGGGSALDTGKAIALMVGQTRPIWDFEDREDWHTRVNVAGMAPTIGVPTTSGTGSEVGRAAVITDVRDHTKKIIFHPRMQPALVIADPELTLGLPPAVTAAVGMDALSHNLEAYCAPFHHPLADGIAVEGMRLIKQWLPIAVADGSNIEARSQMMAASAMGATAFQKGLGAMHSLSHPCSANLNTHHGLTNGVVMPYVLVWNRSALQEKMTRLAAYLGLPNPSFDTVLEWVVKLRSEIGIPHTLAELGMRPEHVPAFAQQAFDDPSTGGNPLPMSPPYFAELYLNCIEGRLTSVHWQFSPREA